MDALTFEKIGDGWNATQPDGEYVGCVLPCHPDLMPLWQARLRDGLGRDQLCNLFPNPDAAKRSLVRWHAHRFGGPRS